MMSLTMILRFIIAHSETRFVEAYNETGVRLAELISCSTNVGAQVLVLSISVLVHNLFIFSTFPVRVGILLTFLTLSI